MSPTPPAPLVTLGITCFNAADTVARAIDSARAQDWPNVEIVVVDDASTDGSVAAIQTALEGEPRGRLIRQPRNAGAAAARNALLREARGDFIAFLDDDDVSAPERARIQVQAILDYEAAAAPPAVACFASGAREYPNGYRLQADAIGSQPRPPVGREVVDYLLLNDRREGVFYGAGTPTCALMARTESLRAVGGFDEGLRRVEDVDLAIRLGLAGAHFIGCPERLYLQYATQGSDKTPTRNLEAELAVVDKHRAVLEPRGLFDYARDWFRFREAYFVRAYGRAFGLLLRLVLRHPVRTTRHLLRSGPARLRHERAMQGPAS